MLDAAQTLTYDEVARRGGDAAMRQLGRFFMGDDPVHVTLHRFAGRLEELQVPYAVAGGMALNAHGFRRATLDVDVLVTPQGMQRIHQELEGLGYIVPFKGSRNLRDASTTVRIEFLVTGQFPGDGKPKPVMFPDPSKVAVEIEGIRYVALSTLIELKLASGMTNPGRLRDLADVQELIRTLNLPQDYQEQLDPYVRGKFAELWQGVQAGGNLDE
jgi:hypothetical protein